MEKRKIKWSLKPICSFDVVPSFYVPSYVQLDEIKSYRRDLIDYVYAPTRWRYSHAHRGGWRTCESVPWWKLRHSTRFVIGQAFVGRFVAWYQPWVVNRILKRRANTQSSSVAGRNRFVGLVCRNDRRNRSVLTINGSDYYSPRF